MTEQTTPQRPGTSRRDFLRRGAIVGGTLVWAAPAVQTLAKPAFANHGTPHGTAVLHKTWWIWDNNSWVEQQSGDPVCQPDAWSGPAFRLASDMGVSISGTNAGPTVTIAPQGEGDATPNCRAFRSARSQRQNGDCRDNQNFTCPSTSSGTGQTSVSISGNTVQVAVVVCCFT